MRLTRLIVDKAYVWWLCIRARISRAIIFPYATLIATFVAVKGIPPLMPAISATIAGLLIALGIYISNDVADLKTDIINLVNRPIAQGRVSENDALTLTATLYAAGLVLSLTINIAVFILCLMGVVLGIFYSFSPIQLKKRFLLKQVAVATGGLISSLAGGAAVGKLSSSVLFAGFVFFTYAMAVVPIVDLGDIIGNGREGRKTLPIVWGPEYTIRLAIAILAAIIISSVVGYLQLGFNIALPILGSVACLSCIYVIYPLFNQWQNQAYCRRLINKITLFHFILQLGIALGSLF